MSTNDNVLRIVLLQSFECSILPSISSFSGILNVGRATRLLYTQNKKLDTLTVQFPPILAVLWADLI